MIISIPGGDSLNYLLYQTMVGETHPILLVITPIPLGGPQFMQKIVVHRDTAPKQSIFSGM